MTGSCAEWPYGLALMPFEKQRDGQLAFLSGPRTVDSHARYNCFELMQRNISLPRRLNVQYLFFDQDGEKR